MIYIDNNLIEHTVEDGYVVLNNRMDIDYILTESIIPAVKIDLDFFPPLFADSGNIVIDGHKSEIVNPSGCKVSSPEIGVHGHEVSVYLNPDKVFSNSINVKGEPLEALISINPLGCFSISPDTTAPITIVDPDGLRIVSPEISITANNTIVPINPDKVLAATSAADAFSISRPNISEGHLIFISPGSVRAESPYPPVPPYNYPVEDAPDTFEEAFDIGVLGPGADYKHSETLGEFNDENDWYKFTITETLTVYVEINFDSYDADFDLELFDSTERVIVGSYTSSGVESVEILLNPGTYYIRVSPYYGETEYNLNIKTSGSLPIPEGAKAIIVFVGDLFNGQPGIILHKILKNFDGVWVDAPANILRYSLLPPFGEFTISKTIPSMVVYNCFLTGKAAGVEDLTLPIKNFQTRLRDGSPTYCGIVVPNVERYIDDIITRKNGEIVIQKGVHYNSGEKIFVELVRVNLDGIGYDIGAKSNSISLSGHKTTQNTSPKTIRFEKIQTESLQKNGQGRIRTDVDFFIKPGDLVVWGDKKMTAELITITVGHRISRMEITGA